MNTQKTLKIIFSLIGLLIIITSGIFILQTLKDLDNLKFSQVKNILHKKEENLDIDTTNWKTYRNEEFGFEFKYPEEWEIGDFPLPPKTNVYFINYEEKDFKPMSGEDIPSGGILLNLNILLNNENMIPENWIEKSPYNYDNNRCKKGKINRYNILECNDYTYLFFYKNLVYGFPFMVSEKQGDKDGAKQIIAIILKTLKPSENIYQEKKVDQSDWKIYNNTKFHYKVSYPAYWIQPSEFKNSSKPEDDFKNVMLGSTKLTDWVYINVFTKEEYQEYENDSPEKLKTESSKQIVVNGIHGEEGIYYNEDSRKTIYRMFDYQDKIYHISAGFSEFYPNQEEIKAVVRNFEIY